MKILKLAVLALMCLFFTNLNAQFSIGVKGGYTIAWPDYGAIQLPENAETDVRGYHFSASTYYQMNKWFQIGLEPGFVKRGAACVPGWQPIFEGDTKLLLNYVELPLMVGSRVSVFNNKIDLYCRAGYGWSMITSAFEEQIIFGSDEPPVRTRIDISDPDTSPLNRFDHGLHGSAGVAFNLKKGQVFLESAYYHGLRDVDPLNTSRIRSANISLGYSFNL